MSQRGIHPDLFTYTTLIKGLCLEGRIGDARVVFSLMESYGMECDVVTYSTLIDGYCKAGMLEDAQLLFLEMNTKGCFPDVVTFATLIGAFARKKESAKVIELLKKMHDMKISPNMYTRNIVLEYIIKDGDCQSWINSLPDFSSFGKPKNGKHWIFMWVCSLLFIFYFPQCLCEHYVALDELLAMTCFQVWTLPRKNHGS